MSDLEFALAAITVRAPVRAECEIDSTNRLALELADAGTPEWTLVSASHQTEGRGRLGRTWVDVPDRALMFSMVVRPTIPPARSGLLSLAAGAAMATGIRDVTGLEARCKWPNDLLLDRSKLGGILAESRVVDERLVAVVLGVGVNLEAPAHVPDAAGVGDVGRRSLLTAFLRRFHAIYAARQPDLAERVRGAWLPLADTIGRQVECMVASGDVVRGRAVGLDAFGGLIVSTDAGERTVAFGEVTHLD